MITSDGSEGCKSCRRIWRFKNIYCKGRQGEQERTGAEGFIPLRTPAAQNIFSGTTVDHQQIQDQRIFALVVPFAAVNVRINGSSPFYNIEALGTEQC
jgi:hypothetical protein